MAVLSPDFLASLNEKVINPAFDIARDNVQGVLRTIGTGQAVQPEAGSKFSWLNQRIGASGDTVNGAILAAATALVVDDGSKFRAGQQISITGSLATIANSEEVLLITAVATNTLTVVRGYGGSTAADIADGATVTIDSTAREENSTGVDDGIFEPDPSENFFQTMDTQLTFSRRALALAQIGNYNDMNQQIAERVNQLTIQMNRMLIRGRKGSTSIGGKLHTTSGGLTYWTAQTGGNVVDNSAAALTLAAIDAQVEQIVLRGGMTDTIAVNTRLGRVIQGLVNANYSSKRLSENLNDRGGLVQLTSDLPILGQINNIVIDTNLTDSEMLMYDSSKPKIIPMASGNGRFDGNWRTLDATQPGQDGESIRIVGDFGVEAKSFKTHLTRVRNIG